MKKIMIYFLTLSSLSSKAQSSCARIEDVNKSECTSYSEVSRPLNLSYTNKENSVVRNPTKKIFLKGQKIIIDTHDREACKQIKNQISESGFSESTASIQLDSLCNTDLNNPNDRYREIITLNETSEHFVTKIDMSTLSNSDQNLFNDTRNLSYMLVGAVGLLWLGPESLSKWNKDDITQTGFFKKYKDNATLAPVIDQDDWAVNYIGHPISGAAYYTIARNNGYSKMQSFGYSALMSTFFWEYGVEAFAEKPSIQDLLSTPILGSILGEVFYPWAEKIRSGDGKVLGSKRLGKVTLFVLNPAQEISKKMNRTLDYKIIKNASTELILSRKNSNNPIYPGPSNYIGIQLRFQW